jgi:myo-inositol-1(or 4)-monophosphatase
VQDQALLSAVEQILRDAMALARHATLAETTRKAHQDFVTNIDLETDRFLEARLNACLPGCPVLSEERAVHRNMALEQYWIVDPIDGTLNMMSGLPFYGIAVALVDAHGPRLAAVGAVEQDELYTAVRGGGARKNGLPLGLSGPTSQLIVVSTGLLDRLVADYPGAYSALRTIGKFRNFGAQALHICAVAQGSIAGVASLEARIWDEAAAGLILREAGGIWTSRADTMDWRVPAALMAVSEQRSIAAHPEMAARLADVLAPVLAAGQSA